MKRNLIILFVVLLAAAVASYYFLYDKTEVFKKETSLYKAVPITSPVFVEVSSLKAVPKDNPVLQHLGGIGDFAKIITKISEVETNIRTNKLIQNNLAKKPVIIALDFIGKNVLKPVVISELKTNEELKGLDLLIETSTGTSRASFSSHKYDGHKIVDIVKSDGSSLHYCAVAGLIILSSEDILVEKCVRQLSSRNITDISYFNKVNKTVTAQSEIAWYINHSRFPDLWANILNSTTITSTNEFGDNIRTNLKRNIQGIQNYASWSEFDMTLGENHVALNGITAADDSLNHFLSVFEGQEAVACDADKLLPNNTSFFMGFTFSKRELFFQNLEQYFELSDSYFDRESKIKEIGKRFKLDSRNALRSLVKNQVVAAITSVSGELNDKSTLFILNNDSRSNPGELLETVLQNYANGKKVEFSDTYSTYQAKDGSNYRIYKFPYPSLPGIWLGKSFRFAQANYAVFWKDNLVFGSSEETLQRYLKDMIGNNSLYRNATYARFRQNIESRANINAYVDVNRIYAINKALFNTNTAKGFDTNEEVFRKFDAISWQLVCEKNIYFNSINLSFNNKPQAEARTSWSNKIGAVLNMKPQIVVNHRNPAAKEIIVQDNENNLHLIAADGKTVWNAPIKGKILGKIHQIDYYRNGRLQYLFNTQEKLYLVDRNGNKVANFPIVFKSPATNGVNVFDYDNNRKYRYFVACENKKVYAYNHEGKIITGWKFGQSTTNVTTPVQHFRVDNKDYIVFKDQSKIYIQNRQGLTRVEISAQFENSRNPLILNLNGTPKIVATDKTGKVHYLFFNGQHTEKATYKFSDDHYFTVGDINGNGIPDFIFIDGNQLRVIDEKGKKIFSKKFDNDIQHPANLYSFSGSRKKIGVCDAEEDLIYLFDANGKLHEGFPLLGNSEFSIGKLTDAQLNLVVGSSDGELQNYILE